MTRYRQMRRLGRRARRAGLQPVMVISADGQFPTPGVVLARAAWRYRSELAPVFTTGAVLGAGWWAHLARPHWWPYFIVGSAVTAWALVTFGAWLGLPGLAEQVYASVTVFAAGTLPIPMRTPGALKTTRAVTISPHLKARSGSRSARPSPRGPISPSSCASAA